MLRQSALICALLVPFSSPAPVAAPRLVAADDPLLGRWDITIHTPQGERPSWLEVFTSGRDVLVGRLVGIVGSARPISRIVKSGDSLHFAIPPQWENGNNDLVVDGRLTAGRLAGTLTMPDGQRYEWTGVRAPLLKREHAPQWGAPIHLIRANDLGGWHPVGDSSHWHVANGVLSSPRPGASIATTQTFGDFKLHVEFRYPKGSNSGVYLRGRHEVQIQDDYGLEPADDRFSGVYGFIAPSVITAKHPGEWQSYDITFVGRMITVVANGKRVICDQEVPGITGGAIDSNEGAPGPLLLQGEEGPIEYRNIVITPAK